MADSASSTASSSSQDIPTLRHQKPQQNQKQKAKSKNPQSSSAAAASNSSVPHHTRSVIQTSDDAATSKLSACQLGYFSDPYLKFFVPFASRRPPLINRGYFSRVAAIWQILHEFCVSHPNVKKQIFSLGAGSDTNYFKLKAAGIAPFKYYEVDFPEAVNKKSEIIEKHPELFNLARSAANESPDYYLIGADLRDISGLESKLADAGFDYSIPTLFLSECVLIYMHASDSRPLIDWSARKFTGGSIIVAYEQILPFDAFGRTMIENLKNRGCDLLAYEDYPDLASHQQRYLQAGYQFYNGWDMNDIYRFFLPHAELKRIEKLELFDEFEEWHMIQAHYHISVAVKEASEQSPSQNQIQNQKAEDENKSMTKENSSTSSQPRWNTFSILGRQKVPNKTATASASESVASANAELPVARSSQPAIQLFYPRVDVKTQNGNENTAISDTKL